MNLEQQVCSLELAKRLRELEVEQGKTLFYWDDSKEKPRLLYYKEITAMDDRFHAAACDYFSAFTVAELGEMLPAWFDSCKRNNTKYDWHVRVFEKDKDNVCHHSIDTTEANARAKMLIYLIENGLIAKKTLVDANKNDPTHLHLPTL